MKNGTHIFALLIIFATFSLSAAEIKKWVDDDGNVHYGNHPPASRTSTQVHIDSAPSGSGNSLPSEGSASTQAPIGYIPGDSLNGSPLAGKSSLQIPIYYLPSGRGSNKANTNGLRPEEMKRLREVESQNSQRKHNKRAQANAEKSAQASTRSRCSRLSSAFNSSRGRKRGDIITEKRNSGC